MFHALTICDSKIIYKNAAQYIKGNTYMEIKSLKLSYSFEIQIVNVLRSKHLLSKQNSFCIMYTSMTIIYQEILPSGANLVQLLV